MATEPENYAPYAAPSNVLDVLTRLRQHGLPEVITSADLYRSVGIPENITGRVLAALRFLGFVEENGKQSPVMKGLRTATTAEYPGQLAEAVKRSYEPVFSHCDVEEATDEELQDAFRFYVPTAQHGRMITLFLGLCKAANIRSGRPAPSRPTQRTGNSNPKKGVFKPPVKIADVSEESKEKDIPPKQEGNSDADYSLLQNFQRQLPKNGQWTKQKREQWVAAFVATLDLLTEVVNDPFAGSGQFIEAEAAKDNE